MDFSTFSKVDQTSVSTDLKSGWVTLKHPETGAELGEEGARPKIQLDFSNPKHFENFTLASQGRYLRLVNHNTSTMDLQQEADRARDVLEVSGLQATMLAKYLKSSKNVEWKGKDLHKLPVGDQEEFFAQSGVMPQIMEEIKQGNE